jgi:hypothetical protein
MILILKSLKTEGAAPAKHACYPATNTPAAAATNKINYYNIF